MKGFPSYNINYLQCLIGNFCTKGNNEISWEDFVTVYLYAFIPDFIPFLLWNPVLDFLDRARRNNGLHKQGFVQDKN